MQLNQEFHLCILTGAQDHQHFNLMRMNLYEVGKDHQHFNLMRMNLYEVGIVTFFFFLEETLKFEIGRWHNKVTSQIFQAHFLTQKKSYSTD